MLHWLFLMLHCLVLMLHWLLLMLHCFLLMLHCFLLMLPCFCPQEKRQLSPRTFLMRMLTSLKEMYMSAGHMEKALQVVRCGWAGAGRKAVWWAGQ